jgi:WD40 repeat protein
MTSTPYRRLTLAAAAIIAAAVAVSTPVLVEAQQSPRPSSSFTVVPQPEVETGMHGAAINAMAVVKGGQLATVSDDKTVRLWSLDSGRLNATLRVPVASGPEGALHAIAVSPSGGFIAVAGNTGFSTDGTASIYFFSVDKQAWAGRIALSEPPADTINDLAFSPDTDPKKLRLAVAVNDGKGLRVVDMAGQRATLADADYKDAITRVVFAPDGRLAAASLDGTVRLYSPDLKRIGIYSAPSDVKPFDVAFSPDGSKLAVSFLNGDKIAILDGKSLKLERFLEGDGARSGHLSTVVWSADGKAILAAGTYGATNSAKMVRRWPLAGGTPTDVAVSLDTVLALTPLPDGGIAFGAADPSWGTLDATGAPGLKLDRATADFRDQVDGSFVVAPDGATVRFGLSRGGNRPVVFDLISGEFKSADGLPRPPAPTGLDRLADWRNSAAPKLDGKPIAMKPNELARSAVFTANGKRLALGTDFGLRLFEGGKLLWKADLASPVWAVSVAEQAGWVVAGLGDGTIRWFDLETGRQALSFFPHADGKRWVSTTVEGFFDHSTGGEKLFGYVVNVVAEGKPKGAEWVSVDQVYSVFYRRDLVVAKLRRSGESEIASTAAKIGGVVAVMDRGLPPSIAITEICEVKAGAAEKCRPAPGDRGRSGDALIITTEQVRLKFKAADQGGGIGRVVVRLNGAVVEGGAGSTATVGGEQSGERVVSLGQGPNELRLSAFNGVGEIEVDQSKQPVVTLTYEREAPASTGPVAGGDTTPPTTGGSLGGGLSGGPTGNPPPTTDPGTSGPGSTTPGTGTTAASAGDPAVAGGRVFVVSIGVNRFRSPEIPPLTNAVADAEGMATSLGGSNSQVTLLTDERATKAEILKALDALAAQAGPDDTAVIFLAGHGVPIDGRYYFLPYDISVKSREAIQAEGVSQDEIIGMLSKLRAWRAAVVLDTCFAGLLAVEDSVIRDTANDTTGRQLVRASGRFILAGAASREEALDGINGHGVFTGALMNGLGGEADTQARGNRDGIVDIFEIGEYAKVKVPDLARQVGNGHRQSPRWFFTGSDLFPLTKLAGSGG